jgi:hypothetical protein
VNGLYVRAAGAEEIVRPGRLIGRSWAAPQLSPLGRSCASVSSSAAT